MLGTYGGHSPQVGRRLGSGRDFRTGIDFGKSRPRKPLVGWYFNRRRRPAAVLESVVFFADYGVNDRFIRRRNARVYDAISPLLKHNYNRRIA